MDNRGLLAVIAIILVGVLMVFLIGLGANSQTVGPAAPYGHTKIAHDGNHRSDL